MPYNSVSSAKKAGFPAKIDGVNLTITQINHLADIYDSIKKKGNVEEPMAVAISTFKKAYAKKGNKWAKTETSMNADLMEDLVNTEIEMSQQKTYTTERPHSALNNLTSYEFIKERIYSYPSKEWNQTMIHRTPMGGFGKPEAVAKVMPFLASNFARCFAGETLKINDK